MRSLVMPIFLYACETWILSADLQTRIQAMETRCFPKILRISNKDHITNEAVRNKIKQATGPYDDLSGHQWYPNDPYELWESEVK